MNATVDMAALSAQHTSPQTAQRTKEPAPGGMAAEALRHSGDLPGGGGAAAPGLDDRAEDREHGLRVLCAARDHDRAERSRCAAAGRSEPAHAGQSGRAGARGAGRRGARARSAGASCASSSGLRSGDAGLELGDMVKADRSLEGQTITFEALLDDDTQLYLKGAYGDLEAARPAPAICVSRGPRGARTVTIELDMGPTALSAAFQYRPRTTHARTRCANARRRAGRTTRSSVTERASCSRPGPTRSGQKYARQLEGFTAARDAANQRANALSAAGDQQAGRGLRDDRARRLGAGAGEWRLDQGDPAGARASRGDRLRAARERPDGAAEGTWQAWIFETQRVDPADQRPPDRVADAASRKTARSSASSTSGCCSSPTARTPSSPVSGARWSVRSGR